ncbi:MAG: hypothetical protein ACRC62_13120 [Microcoleus sp.]
MSDFVVITVNDVDRAIATSGRMRSFLNAKIMGNKSKTRTRTREQPQNVQ